MVIELLAGKMRRGRGRIAAVEDDMRQTYTVKHIWKADPIVSLYPERVLRREVKLLWQFAGLINRDSINPA